MLVGGGAKVTFTRIDDTHTNLLKADGTALGGSPTAADIAYVVANDVANNIVVETTKMAFDEAGVGTVTITHTDNTNAYFDFLDVAAPKSAAAAASAPAELKSENGAKIGGASSASGVNYLMVVAGSSKSSVRYTEMAIVTLKKTSGGTDRTADNWQKQTIEATTVPCKKSGGFAIPQWCFPTSHYGTIATAGDRTIAKDAYSKIRNLTAEA
jgi:hypothetical protein